MEIELVEIRDFLADHPPFGLLPAEVLDTLPKALSIRYLRRGTPFPPADANGEFLYMIRTGAVELRNEQEELVGKFGEGDLYSAACTGENPEGDLRGRAVEDSLFYLLPCAHLAKLRQAHPEFDDHFTASVKARLRSAITSMQGRGNGVDLLATEVGRLLGRAPVTCSPDATIREAAQVMSRERVSALLVVQEGRLDGIITDRDLRSRCVAVGRDYNEPVTSIMSERLVKISSDTPAFEALMLMTRMNVHHLPVVDRKGVVGMISNTDLIRVESANSVYLVGDIDKAASPEALAEVALKLGEVQIHLVHGGTSASHLGQTISALVDALTLRLIKLAQEQLGPAPIPYCWLAVGSHARREQTAYTDQDHALLLDDAYEPAAHGAYFEALARFVSDGLNQCGLFYCPGKVMATNPEWRQPYQTWRGYFRKWTANPERKSLMLACNFFDMRPVYGETPLFDRLRAAVIAQSQENQIFLAYLVANALHYRPPLGFFRNFVLIHGGDHDNSLDLKRHGIIPIIDLARIHALAAGTPEIATIERLQGAVDAGVLSRDGAENLEDAYEFITTLRARHQVEQLKKGLKVDNYIRPDDLSKLERAHLKDAFGVISTMQSALSHRYQAERFYSK